MKRRSCMRMARSGRQILVAGLAILTLGRVASGLQAGQAGTGGSTAAQPANPQVICRPCGEVPPPKGYSCGDGVMVADSVPTNEIAKAAATCKQGTKPANGQGNKKKSHKHSTKCPSPPNPGESNPSQKPPG